MRDGFGVDFLEPLDTLSRTGGEKRGEQTQQGGAGLVEIGNQRIHAAKGRGWINIDIGFAKVIDVARGVIRAEKVLNGAHRGGAHGDASSGGVF